MIYQVSSKLIDMIERYSPLKEDREIYIHGASLFISTSLGTIIVLGIGISSDRFIEALMYEVIMSSSRRIMGGYHCKTYISCLAVYSGIFIIGISTLSLFAFNLYVFTIIQICGIVITYRCCPIQNINKRLSQDKQKVFKRYSMVYISIYLCMLNGLYYLNSQYVNIALYTFIIINLLTVGGEIDYEKSKM